MFTWTLELYRIYKHLIFYGYLALDRSEVFGYMLHRTPEGTLLIYSGLYLNPQILLRGPQLLSNERPMWPILKPI